MAAAPQVTLTGGEGRQAKVVGYDDDKDVAVLKIDLKDLVGLYCVYCPALPIVYLQCLSACGLCWAVQCCCRPVLCCLRELCIVCEVLPPGGTARADPCLTRVPALAAYRAR